MKKLLLLIVIFLNVSFDIVIAQNQAEQVCINPESLNTIGNWQGQDATLQISSLAPTSDNSSYLRINDQAATSASWAYNSDTYEGDYSDANYCLCWDYKVFDDGIAGVHADINPRIKMYNGNTPGNTSLEATYFASFTITEEDDWVTICTIISSDIEIRPPGQVGGWVMAAGSTHEDWDDLIEDVTGFSFLIDVAGSTSQNEIIGIDNFCLSQCVVCDVEVSFHLENEAGQEKTTFCIGESVVLNGSDTPPWNGQSYYIDIHIVNDDGSLSWVGDQDVTGWVSGQPDDINLTDLFENDPDGAIFFEQDVTYQVKLAIDDQHCGWVEQTQTFIYSEPTVSFQLEDEDGNEKSIFCLGDIVILNGSATPPWNGQSYYIDLHTVNNDGTLSWVGDQDVTGWVSGHPDEVDIIKLFENDPDVPVVFQPNVIYQVKLAIDDQDCGWAEQTATFEFYNPTVSFQLEDEDDNEKSTFCIGENVILNGSATPPWNGQSYYIDLHIVNADGTLSWVGDQDVTGWVPGHPDDVNITKLFENDPDVPVVFQPNVIYQVKLAIDDQLCGWAEQTATFDYYQPVVLSHLEDKDGNEKTVFCLEEDVYLDGTATPPWNGQSYYIDLHIVNDDGTLTWVGDQDVTGWVSGTPGIENITELFENDPDVPVVFLPNTTYQVKLAIDDQLCGWAEHLSQFTLEDCCPLGPPTNLQLGGTILAWDPVPGAAGYIVENTDSWPADCFCSNPISIIPIPTTSTSVTLPLGFNKCASVQVKVICPDGSLSLPSEGICVRFGHSFSKIGDGDVVTSITPNPNNGIMKVSIETGIDSDAVSVNIHDTSGRLIYAKDGLATENGIVHHTVVLNSQLKPGIYFVAFTIGNENITKQVIIE